MSRFKEDTTITKDLFQVGTTWTGDRTLPDKEDAGKVVPFKLVVTERNGTQFKGKFYYTRADTQTGQ